MSPEMVHMNSAYAHDFWLRGSSDDQNVELSCLLPYGIFISIEVNRNASFHDIKVVRIYAFKFLMVCPSKSVEEITV